MEYRTPYGEPVGRVVVGNDGDKYLVQSCVDYPAGMFRIYRQIGIVWDYRVLCYIARWYPDHVYDGRIPEVASHIPVVTL